jgi:two-component system NtrC family sensor kinase
LAVDRGPGAVFVIELPVQEAPAAAATDAEPDPSPPRACAILVVDDEREIAEVLAEILTGDGHQVDIAADGTEALERLPTRPYDLILSDVKMPRLDGPGLLREIERRNPALARRFIFLTGDDLSTHTASLLDSLPQSRLNKPFDILAVRRTVARALGART